MLSIYASIFCLVFFALAKISTIIRNTLDANGQVLSVTWEVSALCGTQGHPPRIVCVCKH